MMIMTISMMRMIISMMIIIILMIKKIILMMIMIILIMKMIILMMIIIIIIVKMTMKMNIYITSGNEKNSNTFSPVSIQLCGSMALTQNLSTIKRFKGYCCDCEPALKLSKGRIRWNDIHSPIYLNSWAMSIGRSFTAQKEKQI